MAHTLILVESPNKAKKINQILGSGFSVRASVGHICDLPAKSYGVDTSTFEETYELRNAKLVRDLRSAAQRFRQVLLATDPDREGEAIAWHLARELKIPISGPNRVQFQEITEAAIRAALQAPQPLDMGKVDAARSRRVLDRIVGFDVSSEICWPAGAKSAGRVQTPALHILCEREREILGFEPRTYWTLTAEYAEGFSAYVPEEEDGSDSSEGKSKPREFETRVEAEAVLEQASQHPHVIGSIDQKKSKKSAPAPYTTSTLLQDAAKKLGLSAAQASDYAQSLFEAGYITYHRTDSTRVSDEAVAMARAYIAEDAPDALPKSPPARRTKAGAQDAHEAIRPTRLVGDDAPPPNTKKLYTMIRARFLASQSRPAIFQRTTIHISAGPIPWVAEGSVLTSPGYLTYWRPYARQKDELLPPVAEGSTLQVSESSVNEKQTRPPSRYDTGGLIKKLEASGVGRPSTYKMIIQTLLDRGYAHEMKGGRGKKYLQPTDFGLKVDGLLTATFPDLVGEEYTAEMESSLDRIESSADLDRVTYLRDWYREFRTHMTEAEKRGERYRNEHNLHAAPKGGEATDITCDRCGQATYNKIQRKKGRGSFLACPSCNLTRNVRARIRKDACKQCGSSLIERKGKNGKFFGCVRYGADDDPCTYTEREDGRQAGRYKREEYDKKCPKCLATNLIILTPRNPDDGDAFYACPTEDCSFTLTVGARARRTPCPECGHLVVERRRRPTKAEKKAGQKGKPFWSCSRYPDCTYAQDMVTEEEAG